MAQHSAALQLTGCRTVGPRSRAPGAGALASAAAGAAQTACVTKDGCRVWTNSAGTTQASCLLHCSVVAASHAGVCAAELHACARGSCCPPAPHLASLTPLISTGASQPRERWKKVSSVRHSACGSEVGKRARGGVGWHAPVCLLGGIVAEPQARKQQQAASSAPHFQAIRSALTSGSAFTHAATGMGMA